MKKPAPAFKAFKVGMCVVTNPSHYWEFRCYGYIVRTARLSAAVIPAAGGSLDDYFENQKALKKRFRRWPRTDWMLYRVPYVDMVPASES
jgi:hypothetical protein